MEQLNYLTTEQAAKRAKVGIKRLQVLLRQGRINGAQRFAGRWLIPHGFTITEASGTRRWPGRRGPKLRAHAARHRKSAAH